MKDCRQKGRPKKSCRWTADVDTQVVVESVKVILLMGVDESFVVIFKHKK